MSSIYQTEPPTLGKVVLITSIGPIDIELWPKESPQAVRNFVQLCLEGFYNKCSFFRVIPHFIAQSGDPTSTGEGPDRTIFENDSTFANEFHSRLHFSHRGIVACAGTPLDPQKNAAQFFITLDRTPELEKKHTIFGKVVGDSIFNLIMLNDMPLAKGYEDRLVSPPIIRYVDVLWNPFEDIIPRITNFGLEEDEKKDQIIKSNTKAVKNFNLLSFGQEAQQSDEIDSFTFKKITVAPVIVKKPKKIAKTKNEAENTKQSKQSDTMEKQEQNEWQKEVEKKEKEWGKAERKAQRREKRIQEKKQIKLRKLEDPDYIDEMEIKDKNQGPDEIDLPKFKRSKKNENQKTQDGNKNQKNQKINLDEKSILDRLKSFKVSLSKQNNDWKSEPLIFENQIDFNDKKDDFIVLDSKLDLND